MSDFTFILFGTTSFYFSDYYNSKSKGHAFVWIVWIVVVTYCFFVSLVQFFNFNINCELWLYNNFCFDLFESAQNVPAITFQSESNYCTKQTLLPVVVSLQRPTLNSTLMENIQPSPDTSPSTNQDRTYQLPSLYTLLLDPTRPDGEL